MTQAVLVNVAQSSFGKRQDRDYENGEKKRFRYEFVHAWNGESEVPENCAVKSSDVVGNLNDMFNGMIESGSVNVKLQHASMSFTVEGILEAKGDLWAGQATAFPSEEFPHAFKVYSAQEVLDQFTGGNAIPYDEVVRTEGRKMDPQGATMSSTAPAAEGSEATPASACLTAKGECKSNEEANPWLQIEYSDRVPVTRVVVHRAVAAGDGIMSVRVGDVSCAGEGDACSKNTLCTQSGGVQDSQGKIVEVEMLCPVAVLGRYVQIVLAGQATTLNFAEVEAFSAGADGRDASKARDITGQADAGMAVAIYGAVIDAMRSKCRVANVDDLKEKVGIKFGDDESTISVYAGGNLPQMVVNRLVDDNNKEKVVEKVFAAIQTTQGWSNLDLESISANWRLADPEEVHTGNRGSGTAPARKGLATTLINVELSFSRFQSASPLNTRSIVNRINTALALYAPDAVTPHMCFSFAEGYNSTCITDLVSDVIADKLGVCAEDKSTVAKCAAAATKAARTLIIGINGCGLLGKVGKKCADPVDQVRYTNAANATAIEAVNAAVAKIEAQHAAEVRAAYEAKVMANRAEARAASELRAAVAKLKKDENKNIADNVDYTKTGLKDELVEAKDALKAAQTKYNAAAEAFNECNDPETNKDAKADCTKLFRKATDARADKDAKEHAKNSLDELKKALALEPSKRKPELEALLAQLKNQSATHQSTIDSLGAIIKGEGKTIKLNKCKSGTVYNVSGICDTALTTQDQAKLDLAASEAELEAVEILIEAYEAALEAYGTATDAPGAGGGYASSSDDDDGSGALLIAVIIGVVLVLCVGVIVFVVLNQEPKHQKGQDMNNMAFENPVRGQCVRPPSSWINGSCFVFGTWWHCTPPTRPSPPSIGS